MHEGMVRHVLVFGCFNTCPQCTAKLSTERLQAGLLHFAALEWSVPSLLSALNTFYIYIYNTGSGVGDNFC